MYNFKDLYITVKSETSAGKRNIVFYQAKANTLESTECPDGTPVITTPCCRAQLAHSIQPEGVWLSAKAAAAGGKISLKDYLAKELAKTEVTLSPIEPPANLRTVAEIRALERKLAGALNELQKRKAQLRKRKLSKAAK